KTVQVPGPAADPRMHGKAATDELCTTRSIMQAARLVSLPEGSTRPGSDGRTRSRLAFESLRRDPLDDEALEHQIDHEHRDNRHHGGRGVQVVLDEELP